MDFVCVSCHEHYHCPYGVTNPRVCGDCDEEVCKIGFCVRCSKKYVQLPAHIQAELPYTSAKA